MGKARNLHDPNTLINNTLSSSNLLNAYRATAEIAKVWQSTKALQSNKVHSTPAYSY
jgi:hypothetical protein